MATFNNSSDMARVMISRNALQSIASGSGWSDVVFDATTTNTGISAGTISLSSSPFTFTRSGTFNIAAINKFGKTVGTNGDTTELRVLRNGTEISGSAVSATHYTAAANSSHQGSAPNWRTPNNIAISSGDVIKVQVRHSNASPMSITSWLGITEVFSEGHNTQQMDSSYIWWNFPMDTGAPTCSTSTSEQIPGLTFSSTTLQIQVSNADALRRPTTVSMQLIEVHPLIGTTTVRLYANSAEYGVNANVFQTTPTLKLIKEMSVNTTISNHRTNNVSTLDSTELNALMSIAFRYGINLTLTYLSDGSGTTTLISPRLLVAQR